MCTIFFDDTNIADSDSDGPLAEEETFIRYMDNGDGTVTDNLTELTWLKDAGCLGKADWETAKDNIKQLNSGEDFNCEDYNAGKYNDWRLPTIKELTSVSNVDGQGMDNDDLSREHLAGLTDFEADESIFFSVQSGYYWSSSTDALNTANAWRVGMFGGDVGEDGKTTSYYVWPVRGGQ